MKYKKTIYVTGVLIAQTLIIQAVANGNKVPLARPLEEIPKTLGDWTMIREEQLSEQDATVLRADQVLLRTYATPQKTTAPMNLLLAYFGAQVEGRSPHSPKNCLPGTGFEPIESSIIQIPSDGSTIPVNRYLLAKDDSRILMLYWYQSGRRAVASEYAAKLFLVSDALIHRRTESTIVRITVPLQNAADRTTEEAAIRLAGFVYPVVRAQLPL